MIEQLLEQRAYIIEWLTNNHNKPSTVTAIQEQISVIDELLLKLNKQQLTDKGSE